MQRRPGKRVYKGVGDDGVVEVVDDGGIRSLYLGSRARQSSMRVANPFALELEYTKAMMCALLFHGDPRSALVIGLGGGSEAKFLYRHYPRCRIDAVECRADVVSLAYGYFQLPEDDRLSVHIVNGAQFMSTSQDQFDIIMVDAFDSAGVSPSVTGGGFVDQSHHCLVPDGVFVINLWGGNREVFNATMAQIAASFVDVLKLPVQGGGNVVVFGFNRRLPVRWQSDIREQALRLRQRLGIDFLKFLRALHRHNGSLMRRLFR